MWNLSELRSYLPLLRRHRQALHRIPEPSYREHETSDYVEGALSRLGLTVNRVGTGLWADLPGEGEALLFRADMDALPLSEQTGAACASVHPGLMHACGHDAHMAIVLTFAAFCRDHPKALTHPVRLLFQPGEEAEGGAVSMIGAGALKGVSKVYALHVDPRRPAGRIGLRAGSVMAGAMEFDLCFSGRSAHCAEREAGQDALAAALALLGEFPDLEQKFEGLLHCGKLTGGQARNIVADAAVAECTYRFFQPELQPALLEALKEGAAACTARGVKAEVRVRAVYPPVINDAAEIGRARRLIEAAEDADPWLTAEDFAFYLQKRPGFLAFLGVDEGQNGRLHTPTLYFDEAPLLGGLRLFVQLATA